MTAPVAGGATARRLLTRVLFGALVLAAAWMLMPARSRAATADEGTEPGVKAAYLYKFLGYVEWPATAFQSLDAPQVIGVLGADAVLTELESVVAGRRVNGRPLVARRVSAGDLLDGIHVLHLGRGVRPQSLPLGGRPLLVVTDTPAGIAEHAALNFITVNSRVRFEASLPAAERAGIRLSARLLAVAERVVSP